MSFRPDVWTAANDGSGSNLDADKLDNLSSSDFELALGNPASDGYHLVSTAAGARSWEALPGGDPTGPVSGLTDVTITTIASEELLQWNGSAWINRTMAELQLGEIDAVVTVQGAWTFSAASFKVGGTSSLPDLEITDDGTRDPRLKAGGGKMTLETLGSASATGDGLYLDDGGTTNAKVVGIKVITSSATTPTGDYPYGTLHLIY